VAIGISGYLYYRNADQTTDANAPVIQQEPTQQQLPVSGTQPILGTEPAPTVTTKPMATAYPVEGQTVAAYAMEQLGYNPTTRDWRVHNGMDIAAPAGTAVCAAADGTVYTVYEDETMGHTVVVRHENGFVTCYASLAPEVAVKTGETVTLGQPLGAVGSSALLEYAIGEHVHFSVTCNGTPVDPVAFLNQN
jgi:murein DD-endopeptidase MepM/ murein hydrolase activator NlpD